MSVNAMQMVSRLDTENPIISVVMAVYNGEKYIAEAIESVLAQTLVNFEFIIVDDGSTDKTLRILREFEKKDVRIRVVTRKNKGLPVTLNEAIDLARSQFIVRMDHDDICYANRLASQYEFMQQFPDVVVLGSAAIFIDAEGSKVCTYIPSSENSSLCNVFPGSPFIHPTVMLRKSAFYKAGKYPEKMRWGGEDVILFNRMAKFGLLHNLSDPLLKYRLVPGSMSRKPPEFRKILVSILADEINGHAINDERLQALQADAKKIDKSKAIFDYHFEVAKLYIWSGGNREKSFRHLKECRAFQTSVAKIFFLYLLAIMPQRLVALIYFQLKGRRYEK